VLAPEYCWNSSSVMISLLRPWELDILFEMFSWKIQHCRCCKKSKGNQSNIDIVTLPRWWGAPRTKAISYFFCNIFFANDIDFRNIFVNDFCFCICAFHVT
jgi:hypothetical protein